MNMTSLRIFPEGMKKLLFLPGLLALGCLSSLWSQTATPDTLVAEPATEDSLSYTADKVTYSQSGEQITLIGNTSVTYQQFQIDSDSLRVDLKAKRAYSDGDTVMRDGEQILIGSDVAYDIDSQTGIMNDGSSRLEQGYYSGARIRKIDDDIYDVDNGSFTTCDHADPDFWFSASKLRIYRGDKIVGKPVLVYVNHLPVFYFPYIVVPIKRGRHPGFLIPEPGYNSVDGKFLRGISWYYPYKDYADLILSLDLQERTGWKGRMNLDYIQRYQLSGSLDAAFQKKISGSQTYNDWSLRANHHQELGEKATFDVSLDFVSNKRIWESSDLLDESLAQSVSSSVSFRKPLLSSYLNLGAVYTQDLINDRATISLPSASFSLPSRPLYELFSKAERGSDAWWSNLNYNYSVRLDHTGSLNGPGRSFQDLIWNNVPDPADSTAWLTRHNLGLRHSLGLSYNWSLKGWLNWQHGLNYNEGWFDRDQDGHKLVRGNDYRAYTNASFNIYGIHNYRKGWLKSVRHILTPSAGLSYNPDQSENARFYSFGGVGLSRSEEAANLSLALDQKWQIKYGQNGTKINDLFSFTSRVSANLLKEEKPFGALSHTLAFRPGNFNLGSFKLPKTKFNLDKISLGYSSQFSLSHDPYALRWNDWKPSSQYFTQALILSGSAPYSNYFAQPKNRVFEPYDSADSLQIRAEALTEAGSRENWKLSLAHNIYASRSILDANSHNLRLDASLKVTSNWALNYGTYFDLKTGELITQTLGISRDLHCWKLDISYTRRNEFWEYRVALFNTTLPDALRFQTRDSKRY